MHSMRHLLEAEHTERQIRNVEQIMILRRVQEQGAANDDSPSFCDKGPPGMAMFLALVSGLYLALAVIFYGLDAFWGILI